MFWRIIFLACNIEREIASSISTLPPGNMSGGNRGFFMDTPTKVPWWSRSGSMRDPST